jgi:hypothetical protein
MLGKTHALKSWREFSRTRLKHIGAWFLPSVKELEDFLGFVKKAVDKTGEAKKRKNECIDFNSDQFLRTLDGQFKSHRGLQKVLRVWKTAARRVLEEWVQTEGEAHQQLPLPTSERLSSGRW